MSNSEPESWSSASDVLHQNPRLTEAIVSTIQKSLLVLDADRRVVAANASFYRKFRLVPEDVEGRLLEAIGEGEWNIPSLREQLDRVIPDGLGFDDVEVEHAFPRLGHRVMLLHGRRIDSGDEQPLRVLLAIEDITERKTVERTAAEYAAELERSNRELQDFASIASHDLQEPLRKILSFGDRLRTQSSPLLDSRGNEYLERMLNAAFRMRALIDDLLAYARVSTAAKPFALVDLDRVARDVLRDLETKIAESNARIELGDLPKLEADATQMRQLFQNLLGNALKFRREGTEPVVRLYGQSLVETTGPMAGRPVRRIVVEDEGIGFDPKYSQRIFQVFERLHGRNEYEGTGIGLALCRKIVERHGGTISADSGPGRGATFVVTMPALQFRKGSGDAQARNLNHHPDGG